METEEQEISCSECFDRISAYAEWELIGARPDPKMKQVAIHLEQCHACQEEYEVLRKLVEMDASHQLPDLHDLLESFRPDQPF